MAKNDEVKRGTFPVNGMMCAVCAGVVEKTAGEVEGVTEAAVNFAAMSLTIAWNPKSTDPQAVSQAIAKAGFEMIVEDDEDDAFFGLNVKYIIFFAPNVHLLFESQIFSFIKLPLLISIDSSLS